MNIPTAIERAARRYPELTEIGTGGGFDYVYRQLDEKVSLILSAEEDGGSPLRLDEKGCVMIWVDGEEWKRGIGLKFKNVKKALKFMAKVESVEAINLEEK